MIGYKFFSAQRLVPKKTNLHLHVKGMEPTTAMTSQAEISLLILYHVPGTVFKPYLYYRVTSSYHLDELLILSDRVKDVLGMSISIIRFEYVLYIKARNFNLHKKMQTFYIK